MRVFISLILAGLVASCASSIIAKNCKPLGSDVYECEKL
jgi:hypothetical protein